MLPVFVLIYGLFEPGLDMVPNLVMALLGAILIVLAHFSEYWTFAKRDRKQVRSITMKHVAIIGAGSWGTALAVMAARAGHEVRLWSRDPALATSINDDRVNPRYLSFAEIPERVFATSKVDEALRNASLVLLATPSHAARDLLGAMKSALEESSIIVSVAKGIEIDSGKRISEVVNEVLG